jgi:hypothetical protein
VLASIEGRIHFFFLVLSFGGSLNGPSPSLSTLDFPDGGADPTSGSPQPASARHPTFRPSKRNPRRDFVMQSGLPIIVFSQIKCGIHMCMRQANGHARAHACAPTRSSVWKRQPNLSQPYSSSSCRCAWQARPGLHLPYDPEDIRPRTNRSSRHSNHNLISIDLCHASRVRACSGLAEPPT